LKHALDALDVRFDPFLARHVCPDESTIRLTIGRINPDDLAATGCRYLADLAEGRATVRRDVPDEREARRARTAAAASPDAGSFTCTAKGFAIDGKRLASARRGDGSHVNLLSMVEHGSGTTAAQREIPAKTNEVPEVTQLLAGADVRGGVLTLDALHTQRGTAEAVVVDHHAAYLLMIKANQPNLLAAVAARFTKPNAFFQDAGRYFSQSTTGHGRVESREIRVASTEGIDFPHAAQVFQIIRRSKKLRSRSWEHKEVVFGVTALSVDQAGPADLAGYAKNHWSVENKSHYVM
jgi:predicted transposase YbfD/YdcC